MSTAMKKEFAKAKKILHPNSRKSIAITRKAKKISNRDKAKFGGLIKQNMVGEKMLWMQQNMVDICPYTPEMTAELLEQYITRHDQEMEQIAIKHSVGGKRGRQHASREDILRMSKERELEEYKTCGIEIPDILTVAQCEMLRNWNGELKFLPNFKFRRFGLRHLREALQKENKSIRNAQKKTDITEFTEHTTYTETTEPIEQSKAIKAVESTGSTMASEENKTQGKNNVVIAVGDNTMDTD